MDTPSNDRPKGSTGRIKKILTPSARRMLFERDLDEQIARDLPGICRIDRAHILMLAERGIVKGESAAALLRAIQRLMDERFEPLRSRPSRRGLFLLYEEYLIDTEGAAVGGLLQTGRSRNDLSATLARLRLRAPYQRLVRAGLRLSAVVIRRAEAYADTVMPAYTHGQCAEPITYGHYLAGVGEALRRDLDALLDAVREIDTCPLGAAAVAGSSVAIDPARTASLLGFARSSANSVDAVASRDVVLRLLAAAAISGTTLSRVAADLLQWLTAEFQLLSLPDELVGSSSAMPQKRNPFLLEHVQGRTAAALGALTTALAATRSAPFTNAIAVGTESVRPVWAALRDVEDATTLLRLVVSHARPDAARMERRAVEGFTNATAVAVRLVLEKGMDFRSAHALVGAAVTDAMALGLTSLEALAAEDPERFGVSLDDMTPAACVTRSRYGGGPAPETLARTTVDLRAAWSRQRRVMREQAAAWRAAEDRLDRAVDAFLTT